MKLLWDQKAVEVLQEITDNYASKDMLLREQHIVNKVNWSKKRIDREMQLTLQIGDFEMDQVILDLGSDANILSKKTWERMGKPML